MLLYLLHNEGGIRKSRELISKNIGGVWGLWGQCKPDSEQIL